MVRAELGKDRAWTGEAVPLIVTLYSPGPFSGTASFELPQLPRSAIVRAGNPVVGSEMVGDESYFSQRHEFTIYSQRAGEVVIPAFRVRYSGKKTFTSPAEPMAGWTPELRFQSTHPPGTEHLGMVVAARNLEVSQAWQPDTSSPLQAGDVIARTISRRAVDTTAMMFPPVLIEAPAGVRFYSAEPVVAACLGPRLQRPTMGWPTSGRGIRTRFEKVAPSVSGKTRGGPPARPEPGRVRRRKLGPPHVVRVA